MSDDSLNNPSKSERQRRRRKRASRNLDEFGDANVSASAAASKGRSLALQDLSNQKAPGQVRNPSSGNSNSLELNEERKTKSRRSRKRAPRQGAGIKIQIIQCVLMFIQSFSKNNSCNKTPGCRT